MARAFLTFFYLFGAEFLYYILVFYYVNTVNRGEIKLITPLLPFSFFKVSDDRHIHGLTYLKPPHMGYFIVEFTGPELDGIVHLNPYPICHSACCHYSVVINNSRVPFSHNFIRYSKIGLVPVSNLYSAYLSELDTSPPPINTCYFSNNSSWLIKGFFMLDKALPYVGVIMTKSNAQNYPKYSLPDRCTFSTYQTGFEKDWGEIHYQLGQTKTLSEAVKIFENEFLIDLETTSKQCWFVLNPKGKVVATASLWNGNTFGEPRHRIHWVAVHPTYHGKGLAKALLTKLMDFYNQMEYSGIIYLVTQTWSYKAINIYEKFGFTPYTGVKPINWYKEDYETQNDEAWNLIHQKISEYKANVS